MSTQNLGAADFQTFFKELWGYEPYEWQQRLVVEVLENRRWPSLVDRPTGTGKTALLDAAAFVLAVNAIESKDDPSQRWMPTRTAMVVDRRIVVDQAGFRGQQIADKLFAALGVTEPSNPTVRRVAQALATLSSDPGSTEDQPETVGPIVSGVLRGGVVRDESWATRPDRPALLISTVDQIGSRLLFQGYGLGRGAKPLHAGLLGNDTLIILDEVQLSVPFAETLSELIALQRTGLSEGNNRFHVTEMSATPRIEQAANNRYWIFPRSGTPMLDDSAIQQRVQAEKRAKLVHYAQPKDTDRLDLEFAKRCVTELEDLVPKGINGIYGVIVNRVSTAVRVASLLDPKGEVHLFTGRMRPYDKERVLTVDLLDRLTDRGKRPNSEQPTFVVGTQTLEAGADFDFDGLVTECACRSALVQRFGRVDRAGVLAAQGNASRSAIVPRMASFEDDPVYGDAIGNTWKWLTQISENDSVNFAIASLPQPDAGANVDPVAAFAPLTEPHHLDLWAHTSQPPVILPDVASRLHGLGERSFDINVVWRADITESLLNDPDGNGLENRLKAVPPRSGECLAISMRAASMWLRELTVNVEKAKNTPKVFDVEGAQEPEEDGGSGPLAPFAIQVDESWQTSVDVRRLRPGATIVVPCSYGGLDTHMNWDPTSRHDVQDVAEEVALEKDRVIVRLDLSLLEPESARLAPNRNRASVRDLLANLSAEFDDVEIGNAIRERISAMEKDSGTTGSETDVLKDATKAKHDGFRLVVVKGGSDPSAVAFWRLKPESTKSQGAQRAVQMDEGPDDEDDERSFLSVESKNLASSKDFPDGQVALGYHLKGVADWAAKFAANLSLSLDLQQDLEIAGRLHDLGKADPRFQAWLNGGSPRVELELIAKSKDRNDDARTRRLARKQSGYPKGMRHEILSLAMIQNVAELEEQANDWDLVCHLVASHHGWCRPFAPPQRDQRPLIAVTKSELLESSVSSSTAHGLDALSSPIGDRYWALTDRYGWFELAWLEAILRLADHTESRAEGHILAGKVKT